MIHFAIPWLLGAGVLGSAVITALHFLSVRRPPELLLPTARFLDEGRVRAVSQSAQPSDLVLLVLRVLALLLASAALAGPQWIAPTHRRAQLIVADVGMRADSAALIKAVDSASAKGADAATLTRFVWSDSIDAQGAPSGLRAEFAAALPLAARAASALSTAAPDVDSIMLHVIVPHDTRLIGESWRVWRDAWPGAVRVHSLRAAAPISPPVLVFDSLAADDVLRSAFATRARADGIASTPRTVVLRRTRDIGAVPANTADGTVTIVWPEDGAPAGWSTAQDSAGAIAARGVALVAPFLRTARATAETVRGGSAIAWWNDGAVAALERPRGRGCVRKVGIVVPSRSDLLLDPSADGLMSALLSPCAAGTGAVIPAFILADSLDRTHGGAAAAAYFRGSASKATRSTPSWLAPALLAVALLLLLVEWLLRDRLREQEPSAVSGTSGSDAIAAPVRA